MTSLLPPEAQFVFWLLLCIEGAVLSYLSLRDPEFSDNPRLHAWLAAPTGVLVVGTFFVFGGVHQFVATMLAMGLAACWMFFLARVSAFYLFDCLPYVAMSDHRLVVKRTFDKAEALVKRGEIDRAFRLYIEAARKTPDDPAPKLAMADLFIARGARAQGEAMLKQAADCAAGIHARAPVLFRISDLRRDAGDIAGARKILQDFLAGGPPEPYLANARERLERLAQS